MEKESDFYRSGEIINDSEQAKLATEVQEKRWKEEISQSLVETQALYDQDPEKFMEVYGGESGWLEKALEWKKEREKEEPFTTDKIGNA